ncbi:primase-helicase family protein [Pseudomonas kurunegalensis]|uniref:primase-helicase family protein n=1 Tax=Pseudomonas kurunegalensis TaxID=485880 RepID=UPI002364546A|nr:primase-helicase family protein [Pseudomonas kurunegalensis]MDD2135660.1 DUF5906 domain-containing protein [Pseudomonas kurunegalensis]
MSSNILTGAGAWASVIPPEIKDKVNAKVAAQLAKKEAEDARRNSKRVAKQAPTVNRTTETSSAVMSDLPSPSNPPEYIMPTDVTVMQPVESGFSGAAVKTTAQVQQQPPVQSAPPKSGGGLSIDPESREILRYISQDFVMLTANGDERAYHIKSGDVFGKNGFIKYCSKHYGDLTITKADGSEERQPSGLIWWTWNDPLQRVARRIVMEPTNMPEREGNPEVFNLWYERKKEMCPPDMTATRESIKPLTDHLLYLADDDQVVVRYFFNWMAHLYQYPDDKIPSAFLFYSKFGGVGKSKLWGLLAKVFGSCMVGTCSGRALTKSFDDVSEHKRLLMINEMARSEKADGYENFKNMISEEQTSFEGKGRAAKDIRNITHYIVTTNNKDALPLMQGDRRIAVFMCNSERRSDAYYDELMAWMKGPGPSLLAGVLATWKFDADWNPYAPVPQTEAAKELQGVSQGPLFANLQAMREARVPPFDKDAFTADQVADVLIRSERAKQWGCSVTSPAIGKAFSKMGWEPWKGKVKQSHAGKPATMQVYLMTPTDDWWRGLSSEDRGAYLESTQRLFPVQDQPGEVANHE